jgi:hypothetical protein
MGISQEAENKPIDLKAKLIDIKSGISRVLSFINPDAEERKDFQDAKQIAKEKSLEWSSNRHQQNLHRIGEVQLGNAHVIFSRRGIEEAQIKKSE